MTGTPDPASPIAWALFLFVAGLIAGSFLATLVIRWPEGRSVTAGRSACDDCDRVLAPVELVPLLSAILSHGRCRTCGAAIDRRHWRIELGCGMAGALAGWLAPGWEGACGALFGWLLIALAALDIAKLWLPDALTFPLAFMGLATGMLGLEPPMPDRLIGGVAGFASLSIVGAGYRLLRGRGGLGGGDPKLLGAIGLWLGWRMLPWVLIGASFLGLAIAVASAALRREKVRGDAIAPFGALMAAAAYPIWLLVVEAGR